MIGSLLLPALAIMTFGVAALVGLAAPEPTSRLGEEAINPAMPQVFMYLHSASIALFAIVPIVTTIYLLVRARILRR